MGYEQREFVIPRREFPAMDELVTGTLENFRPTERYILRDLVSADGSSPTIVRRHEPTPLTPDVQYREVRDIRFPNVLRMWEPAPDTPSTLCVSRWFNLELEAKYAAKSACMVAFEDGEIELCERTHEAGQGCYYEGGQPKAQVDSFLYEELNLVN